MLLEECKKRGFLPVWQREQDNIVLFTKVNCMENDTKVFQIFIYLQEPSMVIEKTSFVKMWEWQCILLAVV